MLGLRQLAMFAGPLLAGLLIALFNNTTASTAADFKVLGVAFLFDAFSFAISAWTLGTVSVRWTAPLLVSPIRSVSDVFPQLPST